jgi:hypothetical protein
MIVALIKDSLLFHALGQCEKKGKTEQQKEGAILNAKMM